MIPVCVLVKFTQKAYSSTGVLQVYVDGVQKYTTVCTGTGAGDLAHFLNAFWTYMGSRIMHLDVDYIIEEPPLC